MVFMLHDFKKCVFHTALNVLFVAFVLWCLFGVQELGLVSFKVHFNSVHTISTIFIPRCSLVKDRAKLVFYRLVLNPVLNNVNLTEFIVH
jgi:hypothetical protein